MGINSIHLFFSLNYCISEVIAELHIFFLKSFLKFYIGVCSVLVAQFCLTLCDLMACSQPGFSVHGILQARILERVAISFSRASA